MAKEVKRVQAKVDKELVDDAEHVFDSLGMNFTTGITVYLKRVVANGGIPFDLSLSEEERVDQELEKASEMIPEVELRNKDEVAEWLDGED